ncbi:MAG TPA: sigma-70 family RNA polymerase sigma factor [Planctomycetes bacterium]|nr:sigma-70 family RNA polymerase sigma factor [Planctomycetota bacterium]
MSEIEHELRRLAEGYLRRERPGHTLQTTALIDDTWFRLQRIGGIRDREHFLALAAQAMRRILVDHERAARRLKRGGGRAKRQGLTLIVAEVSGETPTDPIDLLALEEALRDLEELAPRQGRIVELRFFAGLSCAETADVLEIGERTVHREWALAKAFLRRAMGQP